MYTVTTIDKNSLPRPTKFLTKRIMCGACRFKCCNSPSFEVECTEEEQARLDLPDRFPQDGHCRRLTDTGCKHGAERPVYCKFFPLQVKGPHGKQILITSHWATLCCPNTGDYELEKEWKGFYYYKRKDVTGAKRNNSEEFLTLPVPIEKHFATVLDECSESLEELFGEGATEAIRKKMEPKRGFGFMKKENV